MATVTMNGQEYEALLAYKRQFQELHDAVLDSHRVTLDPLKVTDWSVGQGQAMKWPQFLIDDLARQYAAQFVEMSEEVAKQIVASNARWFNMPADGYKTYGDYVWLEADFRAQARWEALALGEGGQADE